jgi:hypothetical protein
VMQVFGRSATFNLAGQRDAQLATTNGANGPSDEPSRLADVFAV